MTPSWLPAVMNALKKHIKVRLYYEIAADFTTIGAGAVGEDIKVGIEHFMRWNCTAVVTRWNGSGTRCKFFRFPDAGQDEDVLAQGMDRQDWTGAEGTFP
jgi:hypothetical protein